MTHVANEGNVWAQIVQTVLCVIIHDEYYWRLSKHTFYVNAMSSRPRQRARWSAQVTLTSDWEIEGGGVVARCTIWSVLNICSSS